MAKDVVTEAQLYERQHQQRLKNDGALGFMSVDKSQFKIISRTAKLASDAGIGKYLVKEVQIKSDSQQIHDGVVIFDSAHTDLNLFWDIARYAKKLMEENSKKYNSPDKAVKQAVAEFLKGTLQPTVAKTIIDALAEGHLDLGSF